MAKLARIQPPSDPLATEPSSVRFENPAFRRMWKLWRVIEILRGGTLAIQDTQEEFLPREPGEDKKKYWRRLQRSILYEALAETIAKIVSKPFMQPVTVNGGVKSPLDKIEGNANREGADLSSFLQESFDNAVERGLTHALVDWPVEESAGLTVLQEEQLQIYPYFISIPAEKMIGWTTARDREGTQQLTSIRFLETYTAKTGAFGFEEKEQVRMFRAPKNPDAATRATLPPAIRDHDFLAQWHRGEISRGDFLGRGGQLGTWELWRKEDDAGEYTQFGPTHEHTFPGIPLVTLYTRRVGFMEATPPLEALAWQNVKHWQLESDWRNMLRFAAIGMLKVIGFSQAERDAIVVAPDTMIGTDNPHGDVGVVEHKGSGIGAMERAIATTEQKMEALGHQPFIEPVAGITATHERRDEARSQAEILTWIRRLEGFAEKLYGHAERWARGGQTAKQSTFIPEGFGVDVFDDFPLLAPGDDVKLLHEMRKSRSLDLLTFLEELKRRGKLSDRADPAVILERLSQETDFLPQVTEVDDEEGGTDDMEETSAKASIEGAKKIADPASAKGSEPARARG